MVVGQLFKTFMVTAIVPARGGSKGITNKNIIDFCGLPLLYWTLKAALSSKYIDQVIVSSDDDTICDIASDFGAEIVRRPGKLSGDSEPSESAILHAVQTKDLSGHIIVFLQNTSPLRLPYDIDKIIEQLGQGNHQSIFSAVEASDFVLWSKTEGQLQNVTDDPRVGRVPRQERAETLLIENGSIYCFFADQFAATKSRFIGPLGVYLMQMWQVFEIDDLGSLEICRSLFKNKVYDYWIGK